MPDFCKNSSILVLVTATVILAILIELASAGSLSTVNFALTAVYLLWISLGSAALLCFLKRKRPTELGLAVGILTSFCVWLIVETMTQWLYYGVWDSNAFIRHGVSALLILLVVFRVFALLAISNKRAQLETQSRLSLLQSKMAPHFLFNSLNTIAELAHINPSNAEQSIASLSSLLRATLDEKNHFHSVSEELELCEKYLELEKWRLGERILVKRQYDAEALHQTVIPKLLIQPLIENAVVHGIAPNAKPGEIEIDVKKAGRHLNIQISNTSGESPHNQDGGIGLAIENIKERLFVIYDDKHKFSIDEKGDSYSVKIRLPLTPPQMANIS